MVWPNSGKFTTSKYRCGHCGEQIASEIGFEAVYEYRSPAGKTFANKTYIYICHNCFAPTYFSPKGKQIPGALYGDDVDHLESDVEGIYREARLSYQAGAYTASVLCCRKLLLNIAVSKGAGEGLSFKKYVEWLNAEGYLPKDADSWVDSIRDKGNEATHEIPDMKREDAELLINFLEMLLKLIFEYPKKAPSPRTP